MEARSVLLLTASLALAGALVGRAADSADPVPTPAAGESAPQYAEHERLAPRSLMLALASAGERLVAVGERGNIILSDDHGHSWNQAETVPAWALLTGVCFRDAQQGVAVGHDEVILVTRDGGVHWTRTHFAPEAQQPLLDVACGPGPRTIAVGAYGTYLTSEDAGATWTEKKFAAIPLKERVAMPDDMGRDFHLNRIVAASPTRLYIAAEGGHIYRTDDGGTSWRELPSPYDGSFFGVKVLTGDVVLAYGMRGKLFRSENGGASWQQIETGTQAMINDVASSGPGGSLVAVGLSGVVLVSRDEGRSFVLRQQDDHKGLTAVMAVGLEALLAAGEGGVKLVRLEPLEGPGS